MELAAAHVGESVERLADDRPDALSRAEEHKQQADAIFSAADENFVWLNKFQTQLYFPYEYEDLQRTRQALVEDVASGHLDQAQKRLPRFLSEQHAAEVPHGPVLAVRVVAADRVDVLERAVELRIRAERMETPRNAAAAPISGMRSAKRGGGVSSISFW